MIFSALCENFVLYFVTRKTFTCLQSHYTAILPKIQDIFLTKQKIVQNDKRHHFPRIKPIFFCAFTPMPDTQFFYPNTFSGTFRTHAPDIFRRRHPLQFCTIVPVFVEGLSNVFYPTSAALLISPLLPFGPAIRSCHTVCSNESPSGSFSASDGFFFPFFQL